MQETKIFSGLVGVTRRGTHHLQRIVDVGRERTLILCRKCAGWESVKRLAKHQRDSRQAYQLKTLAQGHRPGLEMENVQKEGVDVQGRRVPITNGELERLCDFHDEGTFIAQCGP